MWAVQSVKKFPAGEQNTRRLRSAPSLLKRAKSRIPTPALFCKEGGSAEPGVLPAQCVEDINRITATSFLVLHMYSRCIVSYLLSVCKNNLQRICGWRRYGLNDKFVVTPLRGDDGTAVVTTRLPNRLVQKLEDVVIKTGRNRTQVIIMALDCALDRLEIEEVKKE